MTRFIIFSLLLCLFISCEEQMVIIPPPFEVPPTDRVVLIEEMTGVNCPNCPAGSAVLKQLIDGFPGQVVGVGIHGDLLTTPISGSTYDFRTDFSQQIEESFEIFAKPCAVINRTEFPGQNGLAIYGQDSWITFVQDELAKEPKVNLFITSDLDEASRKAEIQVEVVGRENISDDLKVSVVITEGNIIDAQKDVSTVIEEYKHDHVLRTMLTNWNGNLLSNGIDIGEKQTASFSFDIPEEDGLWKFGDIEVVAFVTGADGTVLQAGEVHLKQ